MVVERQPFQLYDVRDSLQSPSSLRTLEEELNMGVHVVGKDDQPSWNSTLRSEIVRSF